MRLHLSATLSIAITLTLTTPAFAGPIDDAQAALKAASADTAKLTAALDMKALKLKDPSQAEALKPLVKQCAATFAKAWKGVLSVPRAERGSPRFKALLDAVKPLKAAVTVAGYAMPDAFFSPRGKNYALQARDTSKYSMSYVKEGKLHDANNYFQRAYRSYKSMSPEDQASANGVALLDLLFKNQSAINAQVRANRQRQQVAGRAKAYCSRLAAKFRPKKPLLHKLYALATGQITTDINGLSPKGMERWIGEIKEIRALIAELKPTCDDAAKRPMLEMCVPTHGRPRMSALYAKDDPINWCSYVPKAPKMLLKWVEATASASGDIKARSYSAMNAADSFEGRKGWLSTDSLGTWTEQFTLSEKKKQETIARFQKLYDAVGAKLTNTDALFAAQVKRMKAVEGKVRAAAPSWAKPAARGKNYGIGLAKKQIKRALGKVKFYSTGGTTSWTIKKNALGVPLYRDKTGWAIFRVKGEPFCQARTFYISENYKGGGKYQKDRSVSFGSVRWQKCM